MVTHVVLPGLTHVRQGPRITSLFPSLVTREYNSINQAKRASRELQIKQRDTVLQCFPVEKPREERITLKWLYRIAKAKPRIHTE